MQNSEWCSLSLDDFVISPGGLQGEWDEERVSARSDSDSDVLFSVAHFFKGNQRSIAHQLPPWKTRAITPLMGPQTVPTMICSYCLPRCLYVLHQLLRRELRFSSQLHDAFLVNCCCLVMLPMIVFFYLCNVNPK
jgi:hypothetical protein